jgi:glyoxylase-like metal-dependent hydrolase (beta-lactamase superfamily II)
MEDFAGGRVPGVTFPFDTVPRAGEALEVADGVLWMRIPLPMRPDHVNVYAIEDDGGWAIVDTGHGIPRVREVWGALLAGPLGGRPVRRVFVTHHHPDHVGNAGWFQSDHGAELWTTRTAWLFARMLRLDEQPLPPDALLRYWRAAGMAQDIFADRQAARPMNFADVLAPMPLGFRRIAQGEEIGIGGRVWRVEIGDGHAPEHATLWSTDGKVVIVGDQVLPTITSNLGVYATEPDADPVGDWIATCRRLLPLADPDRIALPGHQKPFRGLDARLRQLIDHQTSALAQLAAFLREPRTACDCFAVLYGRRIGASEYGLALGEAVGHLNHLLSRGSVTRETTAEGVWLWRSTGDDIPPINR